MSVPSPSKLNSSKSSFGMKGSRGFTMIEIMIVVAIIGILASIAFPSYTEYVRKSQVTEAPTILSDMRTKMEQYYLDNRNYGTGGKCGPWLTPDVAVANALATGNGSCPTSAVCSYFDYKCVTTGSEQGYNLTATGKTGRAVNHQYTLNQLNVRTTPQFNNTTPATPSQCWRIGGSEC